MSLIRTIENNFYWILSIRTLSRQHFIKALTEALKLNQTLLFYFHLIYLDYCRVKNEIEDFPQYYLLFGDDEVLHYGN